MVSGPPCQGILMTRSVVAPFCGTANPDVALAFIQGSGHPHGAPS